MRGDTWINTRFSPSQAIFCQGWDMIPVSSHPLPAVRHCYKYRKKKLFLCFLFFSPSWECLKVVGRHISEWGILILFELETFMTLRVRDYGIGARSCEGSESKPLDSTWTLPKVAHFSYQATKAPRGFLCSFIARGGKEIKGFGPVSLTVWCNFVVYRGTFSIFCGLGCSKTSRIVESFKELQHACIESSRRESDFEGLHLWRGVLWDAWKEI